LSQTLSSVIEKKKKKEKRKKVESLTMREIAEKEAEKLEAKADW
jgi:hypothetical protein